MKTCKHGYAKESCEVCKFYDEYWRKKFRETFIDPIVEDEKKFLNAMMKFESKDYPMTADQLIKQGGFYDEILY